MHKVIKYTIGIVIGFMLCFQCLAFSEEKKIIAVFPTWEPYGYIENEKAVGFEIETFAAVMKQMNMAVEFLHQPWKRCLYSIEHGMADVVISALKVPQREKFMYYPEEPISISKTAFFSTTENKIEFNGDYEGLKGYSIGITSGFSYGPAFDAIDYLKKDESTETEAVLIKVLMGRNELGIGNIPVITSIARKKSASDKIRFLEPLVHTQKLYVGFSKARDHERLVKEFSKVLHEFRKSSECRRILEKYGVK